METERFSNESERMLRIDVDGGVWVKPGAAVAYRGDIAFERRHTIGAPSLADAVLRETAPLVKAAGKGRLYCGDRGAHVHIMRLSGQAIVVSWQELLAFEETLRFESRLVGRGIGIAAGGMVVVTLSGHGALALATHGRPLELSVAQGESICTDPHATVAWSANLTPSLKTDMSWRSAFGHGGHEAIQMSFEGAGVVYVQPYEDASRFKLSTRPLKKLAAALAG